PSPRAGSPRRPAAPRGGPGSSRCRRTGAGVPRPVPLARCRRQRAAWWNRRTAAARGRDRRRGPERLARTQVSGYGNLKPGLFVRAVDVQNVRGLVLIGLAVVGVVIVGWVTLWVIHQILGLLFAAI